MTKIIGLIGLRGSGKSACAELMIEEYGQRIGRVEHSDAVLNLANQLHEQYNPSTAKQWQHAAQAMVSLEKVNSFDHHELHSFLSGKQLKFPINRANKNEFRNLLAWLGGYVQVALDDSYWDKKIATLIKQAEKDHDIIFVGGARFSNNIKNISSLCGAIVKIERPGLEAVDSATTENRVNSLEYDYILINDSDLAELKLKCQTLLENI